MLRAVIPNVVEVIPPSLAGKVRKVSVDMLSTIGGAISRGNSTPERREGSGSSSPSAGSLAGRLAGYGKKLVFGGGSDVGDGDDGGPLERVDSKKRERGDWKGTGSEGSDEFEMVRANPARS